MEVMDALELEVMPRTETVDEILQQTDRYRVWYEGLPEDYVFCDKTLSKDCRVAKWLRHELPDRDNVITVGADCVHVGARKYDLPDVLREDVRRFDNARPTTGPFTKGELKS